MIEFECYLAWEMISSRFYYPIKSNLICLLFYSVMTIERKLSDNWGRDQLVGIIKMRFISSNFYLVLDDILSIWSRENKFLFDDQTLTLIRRFDFSKQTLTYLGLYQNQIGDQGAQHLGDALKTNTVSYFSPRDTKISINPITTWKLVDR